jgi:hypothetical protein
MLRNAARRAISHVRRGINDMGATSTLGNPTTTGAPRCYAKPARRAVRKVGSSGAGAGVEKGKALQPIAQAWTVVADVRTGKSYW